MLVYIYSMLYKHYLASCLSMLGLQCGNTMCDCYMPLLVLYTFVYSMLYKHYTASCLSMLGLQCVGAPCVTVIYHSFYCIHPSYQTSDSAVFSVVRNVTILCQLVYLLMCNGHALQLALSGGGYEYAHVCMNDVRMYTSIPSMSIRIGPLISTRYCLLTQVQFIVA